MRPCFPSRSWVIAFRFAGASGTPDTQAHKQHVSLVNASCRSGVVMKFNASINRVFFVGIVGVRRHGSQTPRSRSATLSTARRCDFIRKVAQGCRVVIFSGCLQLGNTAGLHSAAFLLHRKSIDTSMVFKRFRLDCRVTVFESDVSQREQCFSSRGRPASLAFSLSASSKGVPGCCRSSQIRLLRSASINHV